MRRPVFSPDGRRRAVFTNTPSTIIEIWEGERRTHVIEHSSPREADEEALDLVRTEVSSVVFLRNPIPGPETSGSNSGVRWDMVATAALDGTIKFWDISAESSEVSLVESSSGSGSPPEEV